MAATADNLRSIAKYRAKAAGYDATTGSTLHIRALCIDSLALREGQTVLDVGCGTGLSFEPLLRHVGRAGRVLAFEQSPEMHALATARAARLRAAGWNVDLQLARAEDVRLPGPPDAALWHYVHDITRTPAALDNLFAQMPAGMRVAIAGMKFFPWVLAPLNVLVWLKNLPYNVRAHQLRQPWSLVEARLDGFRRRSTQGGMGYIATGRVATRGLE